VYLDAIDVFEEKTCDFHLLVHEFLEQLGDDFALDDLITDPRRHTPEGTPYNSTREGRDWTTFDEKVKWQKLVRKDR
jgi:hypothetical protein